MQAPILSGVRIVDGEFATSYPVNLVPRAIDTGVSKLQLVNARGAASLSTGPGTDRGGINWNDTLYRAMGSKLVSVASDGTITAIGEIGNDWNPASFTYSFDRLAIRSAGKLFYYDLATLTEVTDPDLGVVRDVEWIDGFFMTTDGTYIIVTELSDPFSILPLKYGSAESDPDAVTGLLKLREEMMVLGRYTVQVFQNVGGNGFPFAPFEGATIPYGCVGPNAKCLMGDTYAFVGGGKGEPVGVFVGGQGQATRISTREIEDLIAAHSDPGTIQVEQRVFPGERHLIVHLDAVSLCLSITASQAAEEGAWTLLQSARGEAYRPRNAVLCYGSHFVGDLGSAALATLTKTTPDHFGATADWQMDAGMLFNDGMGAVLNEVELHGLFPVTESSIFFSVTFDGRQWSNEVARKVLGTLGERVVWRPGLRVPRLVGMRWRGAQRVSITRAEVQAEALAA